MTPTILLVEDSADDVFFMKRALKISGVVHQLQIATDGERALEYLAEDGPCSDRNEFPLPGLVLLDLRLPKVPGFDVLKWMRAQPRLEFTPVIVLSSSREERDMRTAYSLRANSFLVKSPDCTHLARMVKALTDYWLVYNEVPSTSGDVPGEESTPSKKVESDRPAAAVLSKPFESNDNP